MIPQKDLRIVYMGTPDFAVEPLKSLLHNGFNVAGVVTSPDKPAGRGRKLTQSAVKQFAVDRSLNILQPENLKDKDFVSQLTGLNPDIIIVVAFRMLPKVVWAIPKLGTFNLHASLLPQYRGAAPINWAIINGETKTGLTTFLIDEKIDTGSIILRHEVKILPNETAGELHNRLMAIGGDLVVETVNRLVSGNFEPLKQEELLLPNEVLRPAPKLFKENLRIDWTKKVHDVNNFVRGLSPYPAAWSELKSENNISVNAKIFSSQIVIEEGASYQPGRIRTDGKSYIHVECCDGVLAVNEIQIAGKRNLPAKEFLLGFKDIETSNFLS